MSTPLDAATSREIKRFLNNSGNMRTHALILLYLRGLLPLRFKLMEEALENCVTPLVRPVPITNQQALGDWVLLTQGRQLEALTKIFMLFEDFLTYSHALRTDSSTLPSLLASKSGVISDEIKALRKLRAKDMTNFLHIVDIAFHVPRGERVFFRQTQDKGIRDIYARLKRLITFWNNHYHVYLKYKHSFSAILGLYQIERGNLSSHIYLRTKFTNKAKSRVHLLIIGCDLPTITYYQEIGDDLTIVLNFLLNTFLYYIYNCGRPFFPPFPSQSLQGVDGPRLQAIVDALPFRKVDTALRMNVNILGPRRQAIISKLARDYAYQIGRDPLVRGTLSFS